MNSPESLNSSPKLLPSYQSVRLSMEVDCERPAYYRTAVSDSSMILEL